MDKPIKNSPAIRRNKNLSLVEGKTDLETIYKDLNASSKGLSEEEAQNRLQQYGYNELSDESENPLKKFFSYFWGPIPWMIEVAVILSAIVGHWADFGIILTLLVVNAGVGFWEEFQAGNAIAALKANLALNATVLRSGKWVSIPARELVPGDAIQLHIGDIIPADAVLMEDDQIEVDQSALTGESLPVTRKKEDLVYSGSVMKQGETHAVVSTTGENTYFGKTAQLVEETHEESHFQKAVLKIGNFLIYLAIALVIIILGVALFRGDPMLTTLQFALVLTVAAIPVAMPTVLSVTMAVGAKLLAKKQAIVSRLSSIEEMAGIDMLCSDKTGTLTQNKLTLGDPFLMDGVSQSQIFLDAALASERDNKDPIEHAIFNRLDDEKISTEGYELKHFTPFDPVHKRTEALIRDKDGTERKVSKGAVQVIVALAKNVDDILESVDDAVNEFASRGFRSLAVASTNSEGEWQILGVLPFFDPPREDSKETIRTAKEMGIRVKMVTGDQLAIAKEVANELDLGQNILDTDVFNETKTHQVGQLEETIENSDGFAQVFPEHKYHIVDVLQKKNHIVGMTGDGVNDAPALKKADAGIAVAGATDAARAAADIVLLNPGLSVIVDAVKESRKIFQRMNSYAIYRIAETVRVLLFMTLSIIVFNFYPVTAVMIVLLALLNDGAILSIAYDNVHYSQDPERWNLSRVLGIATVLGILGVIASFGMFYLGEKVFNLSPDMIQTLMYLKLSVAGHLTIFLTRTRKRFWSIKPAPILLGAVFGTQTIATLIAVFGVFMAPIGWKWALFVWGYAIAWFLVNDQIKVFAYKIFEKKGVPLISLFRKL